MASDLLTFLFSSPACCFPGEVLRGLDDSRRPLGREGPGQTGALPGPGVSPQLRSGEAEDSTEPTWPQRVLVHAHDLSISNQTRGAVRVPLAQRPAVSVTDM